MKGYILGIDSEDSGIECLLCKENGEFVDHIFDDLNLSCATSLEYISIFEKIISEDISLLLERNNINIDDISFGVFSFLKNNYKPYQKMYTNFINKIGIKKYELISSGFLGINVVSKGFGICVTNGMDSTVVGLNKNGELIQIGGIENYFSNIGGSNYILQRALKSIYDYHFKFGEYSNIIEEISEALDIRDSDDLLEKLAEPSFFYDNIKRVISLVDKCALLGDEFAMEIFDNMGIDMAKTALECFHKLNFKENDDSIIIKSGHLWSTIKYKGMSDKFLETLKVFGSRTLKVVSLNCPPVVSSILYGMESISEDLSELIHKKNLIRTLSNEINSRRNSIFVYR